MRRIWTQPACDGDGRNVRRRRRATRSRREAMPTSALWRAWRRDALQARSSAWRTVAHRCAIRRQGRAARSGRLLEEGDRLDLDDSVFRGQTDDLTNSALARTSERRSCTHVRAGSRSPMCLTSAAGQIGRGRACDVQIWGSAAINAEPQFHLVHRREVSHVRQVYCATSPQRSS